MTPAIAYLVTLALFLCEMERAPQVAPDPTTLSTAMIIY